MARGSRSRTAENPGSLAEKVAETVGKLTLAPEDVALAELALRYARTIDTAEALAEDAAHIPFDPDTAALVARLRTRVDAHVAMADVGPKLLAALDALGATPKARAAVAKGAPPAKPSTGAGSALAALRGGAA